MSKNKKKEKKNSTLVIFFIVRGFNYQLFIFLLNEQIFLAQKTILSFIW